MIARAISAPAREHLFVSSVSEMSKLLMSMEATDMLENEEDILDEPPPLPIEDATFNEEPNEFTFANDEPG